MSADARMTLAQLRVRWGSKVPAGVPLAIEVDGMSREMWLLVDPPRGEDSTYRLEREWTP